MTACDTRVTIVVPSFNQGRFLGRTLRSIIEQGYPSIEIIVLDAGSTDGSVGIISQFAHHISFWRSAPDRGQPAAINEGIARSSGHLVTWLNSDDLLLPGAIAAVVDESRRHPHVDVFYGHHITVNEHGHLLAEHYHPPWSTWVAWRSRPYIAQPGTFIRARAWHSVGGVDETLHCAFDYDLWYRLMSAGCAFRRCGKFLSAFRIHLEAKGRSSSWRGRYQEEMEEVDRRYLSQIRAHERFFGLALFRGMQVVTGNYTRTLLSRAGVSMRRFS